MADTAISAMTALTTPASSDYVPIIDASDSSDYNKRITLANLLKVASIWSLIVCYDNAVVCYENEVVVSLE